MFFVTITRFRTDHTITTESVKAAAAYGSVAESDIYTDYVAIGHVTDNGHCSVSSECYRYGDGAFDKVHVYHNTGLPAYVSCEI